MHPVLDGTRTFSFGPSDVAGLTLLAQLYGCTPADTRPAPKVGMTLHGMPDGWQYVYQTALPGMASTTRRRTHGSVALTVRRGSVRVAV
jgi:hypothetical protein